VTDEGLVVLASEVGVLEVPPEKVVRKGRLQPGRMFLVDTAAGRIVDDDEIKDVLAAEHPYAEWLEAGQIQLDDLPPRTMLTPQHASVVGRQRLFGYTNEELRLILQPMAKAGAEPIGSMGSDTAIAALSDRPRLLYDYFTQLFAQVTNPPLDAIREELVTSLLSSVGPEANLLEPTAESCRQIVLPMPVIDNDDLAKLLYINEDGSTPGFRAFAIDGLFEVAGGGEALASAIEDVRSRVSAAIEEGADVIVLSDRNSTAEWAPIPSLLLVSAVHHHLVREKTRTQVGLVVETGDAREVHHMALLKGFGAAAINPYLAFESIDDMVASGLLTDVSPRQAQKNYIKAASKGILKVMSKMGISTVASYTGAQVFEAVGIAPEVIDEYFTGTVSRIGGVGLDVLASEVAQRHRTAHLERPTELAHREREVGGGVPVAPRGGVPPLQPPDGVQAAARRSVQALRRVQGVHQGRRRPVGAPGHATRPDAPQGGRAPTGSHRGGGAGIGHPGPLLDRRHVLRFDLGRGPRDAGHRHEPPGGAVQHR
jgi:glutamate synthase (NADPH/NADH) large chain